MSDSDNSELSDFENQRGAVPLNRNVVKQIRRPMKLALTAKSCLMNLVPDWATKFTQPPDPARRKRKSSDSDSSAAGGSAGTRRSKRMKLEKEKIGEKGRKEEEEYSDSGNSSVEDISSSEELDEAVAVTRKRVAEILPKEELQRWVGLVKTELGVRKSKLRLEREALQAIEEMHKEWKKHMAKTEGAKKGDPLPLKMTWPGPVCGSFVTDNLISEEVRGRLIAEVEELEGVRNPVTWHPNTNKTVYNVVHPALYPFMNRKERRTPVLRKPYQPVSPEEVVKIPKGQRDYSCLFHLPQKKSKMKQKTALSFTGLYRRRAYDRNFTDPEFPLPREGSIMNRVKLTFPRWEYFTDKKFQWIPSNVWVDDEGGAHFLSYINGLNPLVQGELYQLLEEVLTEMIPMFEGSLNCSLRSKKIQVYPQISSVLLSPDNPSFQGERKHVEGFYNEKILATGVYYYSEENVTTPNLSVHYSAGRPVKYQVNFRNPNFGLHSGSFSYHDMRETSVNCAQGRCVVLPNCEHNMEPFQLEDATRAGNKRSLAFFLVDPARDVLSTENVPVQQKAWFTDFLRNEIFPQLPSLPVDRIAHFTVPSLLSEKDAAAWHAKMEEKRTAIANRAATCKIFY